MNKFHRLESVLAAGVWLTEWGVYLVFCGVSLIHPAVIEEIGHWVEDDPYKIAAVIGIWVVLHFSVRLWYQQVVEENRKQAYHQWAIDHNWRYDSGENRELYIKYGFLHGIPGYAVRSLSSAQRFPCMIHVLEGTWRGHPAQGFTYYSRKVTRSNSGKSTRTKVTHYYLALTLIQVDAHFPKIYLRPAHWFDQVMKFIGWHPDQDTLSLEIKNSKNHYQIQTTNLQFANQFFHPTMREFLSKGMQFEIDRNVLVLYQKGRLKPEAIEQNLECLYRLYQLIPSQWKR